ncbi:MAG: hypothetical protein ACT4PV_13550 [Planctomycetaceae bacterium]
MRFRLALSAVALAFLPSTVLGDEPDAPPPAPPPSKEQPGQESPPKEGDETVVSSTRAGERARTLSPQDIPAEMARIATKADIKAELSLRTIAGRPITFRGVIRNGKMIERILDRKFILQRNLDEPDCGVRLWWANDTEGYIFFKYSAIQSLTITGLFTREDMRKLLEALDAKRRGAQTQAATPAASEPDPEKLSPEELQAYLVTKFPYDKGWNHDKKRELTRRKIIENQALTAEEALFEKYFAILAQARFEELQKTNQKVTIEPGSSQAQPAPAVPPEPQPDSVVPQPPKGPSDGVPVNPPPPPPPSGPSGDGDEGDEGNRGDEGDDEPPPPEQPDPSDGE